ncbi:MAG TPA: hypothetical protein VNH44_19550 [Micropepsaceae bacterium]|nr:hypothetical protein [Micropepsaceae bacterium]
MTEAPAPSENVPAKSGRIRRLAKSISAVIAAVGIVSAGIGYITNGAQFFSKIEDYFYGRSELHTLIDTAEDRLAHTDYEAAWAANMKARQLAPRDAAVGAQQARIAMKWLEDVHVSSTTGPKSFTELADPLKAALLERLPATKGREHADIRAHIGWANFLRYRDGSPKTDIGEEFDATIAEDPDNFYGHLLRGFWSLWNGDIEKARPDLAIAMQSTVDPAYSDGMIMAGFTNSTTDDFMAAAIEYADKIRAAGRTIDDHTRGQLLWYYSMCLHDQNLLTAIGKTLPASEQISLLDWLKKGDVSAPNKRVADYFIAYFSEQDGKKDDALRLYNELVNTSEDKRNEIVAVMAAADAKRLQKR